MSSIENSSYIIQTGAPNFLRSGNGGTVRKDNELIRILKRLEVNQFIHIPASKSDIKSVTKTVKNSVAVAKSQMKKTNPNLALSYGIAVNDGVYGVSVTRLKDKTPNNAKLNFLAD